MKFSVVIPTYNRASELKRALISLQNQTFNDFEVLICDDGSTDETKAVVDDFIDKLDVKYFYHENWGGPAKPRNVGILNANSEWLCFLDSDDWWDKEKLSVLSELIDKNSADVYFHQFMCGGKLIGNHTRSLYLNNFENLLLNGNRVVNSSLCVSKNLAKKVSGFTEDKDLIAVEDYDFLLKLAITGARFHLIKKHLGYYELGNTNISANFFKQIKRVTKLIDSYECNKNLVFKKKALVWYMKGSFLYDIGKHSMAKKFLIIALLNGSLLIRVKSLSKILFLILNLK